MDFNKLLEVVKQSHVATIRTMIIMTERLGENTNVDYSAAIAEMETHITTVQAL